MAHKTLTKPVKGYKIFDYKNGQLVCRGFKFGAKTKVAGKVVDSGHNYPELCFQGFHFCKSITNCLPFYSYHKDRIVCEVEAISNITVSKGERKFATTQLRIVRVLTHDEVIVKLRKENAKRLGSAKTVEIQTVTIEKASWSNSPRHYFVKLKRTDGGTFTYSIPRSYALKENLGCEVDVRITRDPFYWERQTVVTQSTIGASTTAIKFL